MQFAVSLLAAVPIVLLGPDLASQASGFEPLTTALYLTGDPYLKSFVSRLLFPGLANLSRSDAVFGVKSSLVVDLTKVEGDDEAKKLGFLHGPYFLLERDWVLITLEEAEIEKRKSLVHYYNTLQAAKP